MVTFTENNKRSLIFRIVQTKLEGGHSGHFLGKWCKSIFGKKF